MTQAITGYPAGGWMVGHENDGLAALGDLDGAPHHALAQEAAVARGRDGRALEAQAHAIGVAGDDELGAGESGESVGLEAAGVGGIDDAKNAIAR
jgi:hypothetical protein